MLFTPLVWLNENRLAPQAQFTTHFHQAKQGRGAVGRGTDRHWRCHSNQLAPSTLALLPRCTEPWRDQLQGTIESIQCVL